MKGRPTSYTPTIQKQADEYVNGGFADCGDVVPSVSGLALKLNVTRQTLHNWKEVNAEFLDTFERIGYLQERISLNGGLKGELNSTIAKLLLANYGYHDKQNIDHTTQGDKMQIPISTWAKD